MLNIIIALISLLWAQIGNYVIRNTVTRVYETLLLTLFLRYECKMYNV